MTDNPFILPRPIERSHQVSGLHVQQALPLDDGAFPHPVLMVHGAFHGWWAYARWLTWFATLGVPAFALSVRNHEGSRSLSAEESRETGIEHYVEDIATVLDWIGKPAVLIGHSLGGLMVQKAAEDRNALAVACIGSASPAGVGPTRDFTWDEDEPLMFDRARMRGAVFEEIDDAKFEAIYGRMLTRRASRPRCCFWEPNMTGSGCIRPKNLRRSSAPTISMFRERATTCCWKTAD